MNILPNRAALVPNAVQPFSGSGGVLPYAFALVSGDGAIDPVTGLYTAPNYIPEPSDGGFQPTIVQVTDANGDNAEAEIMVGSALQLLCDIIETEMELQPGRVYLWDQKINAPTDQGLFVAVGVLSPKPLSNILLNDSSGSGLTEVQKSTWITEMTIDVISRGPEARDRKEEVLMALKSTYCEQQQNQNAFRVFPMSTGFVNLSQIDGAAIPYRFQILTKVQYTVTKTKPVSYYDTFSDPTVTVNL